MTNNAGYALEMIDISKSFGNTVALSNVDLRVKKGTIHGLIGQNGAGKSTLMKILSGLYPSGTYSGQIVIDGKPVELTSTLDAQSVGISIVPQETTVADTLTVAENILLPEMSRSPLKPYNKSGVIAKVAEFLKFYSIPLQPEMLTSSLTLAEKQILMIARAIYMQPEVLVLDEPTSSLTGDEIKNLFAVVRTLKSLEITTVFITHKMDEIIELCDLITILRDGKIVCQVDRVDFKVDELVSHMIGRDLGELYPQQQLTSQDAPVVLSVRDLVVGNPSKPGQPLLEPFSFELRKGEILGIGGLVGSGRTEIVKSLFGHYKILGGEVQVQGNSIKTRSVSESISHGFGYITEDRKAEGLFFNLAIKQNLTASIIDAITKISFLLKGAEKSRARVYLESLQVKPQNLDEPISSLSGGNQQKVVLGKSLITDPKILMLDEPTKGVDIASKAEIYRTITDYAKDGNSVLLISSEFPELLAMSHRVIVFSGGRFVGEISGGLENEKDLMLMAIGAVKEESN
jgi:ABC-type sugar transport system ATPase subunit